MLETKRVLFFLTRSVVIYMQSLCDFHYLLKVIQGQGWKKESLI